MKEEVEGELGDIHGFCDVAEIEEMEVEKGVYAQGSSEGMGWGEGVMKVLSKCDRVDRGGEEMVGISMGRWERSREGGDWSKEGEGKGRGLAKMMNDGGDN